MIMTWLSKKVKINKQDLIEIVNQMDKDKDGYISVSELVTEVKRWWKQNRESPRKG